MRAYCEYCVCVCASEISLLVLPIPMHLHHTYCSACHIRLADDTAEWKQIHNESRVKGCLSSLPVMWSLWILCVRISPDVSPICCTGYTVHFQYGSVWDFSYSLLSYCDEMDCFWPKVKGCCTVCHISTSEHQTLLHWYTPHQLTSTPAHPTPAS